MNRVIRWSLPVLVAVGGAAAASDRPYDSRYRPLPAEPLAIENVTLLTGTGARIDGGAILLADGKIAAIGQNIAIPTGVRRIDGTGKWVTPGLVDPHSHIGVYSVPAHENSENDINEVTDPNTAEVWVEHSVWAQDPQFPLALAGGVTSQLLLPGSKNLFSGRGVVIKTVPGRSILDMKFPGAPASLKMTCGENPKRVYGDQGRAPASRMGNIAASRTEWIKARAYLDARADRRRPPLKDLRMETLAGVLDGTVRTHMHCYRAEDMIMAMEIAREFGFTITAFHHATEAYKIADLLAEAGTCAAMWYIEWGFKHESFDMAEENVVMVARAGACAMLHTDMPINAQRMTHDAALVMAAGNRSGYGVTRAEAIGWITSAPARALGIADQTGSLEVGKMADVVLWDGDPFSVYTLTEKVFIDGAVMYDRTDAAKQPATDFEIGILDPEGERP